MIRARIGLSTVQTLWVYLTLIIVSEFVMNLASQLFGTVMVIVLLFFLVYQASKNTGSPLYHFYLTIVIVPIIQLVTGIRREVRLERPAARLNRTADRMQPD